MNDPKRLALVSLLGLITACYGAQQSSCGSGPTPIPGSSPSPTPAASPAPSPSPAPGATPDPCRIEAVRVGFSAGAQPPFVALGSSEQLDATPVNASGEVPKGCNVAREPIWATLTPITCQIIGSGYNPFLRGLRVGTCSITATVASVVSAPFSAEVR